MKRLLAGTLLATNLAFSQPYTHELCNGNTISFSVGYENGRAYRETELTITGTPGGRLTFLESDPVSLDRVILEGTAFDHVIRRSGYREERFTGTDAWQFFGVYHEAVIALISGCHRIVS